MRPVGDAAITFDPICGQGGDVASRSAKLPAEEIERRAEEPFDEIRMTEVDRMMWER